MFGKIKDFSRRPVTPSGRRKEPSVQLGMVPPTLKQERKRQKLQRRASELSGSQFRILNELLYTHNSREAVDYFSKNKEHFGVYHQGFRRQAEGWKVKPIDQIIHDLKARNLASAKIVDLGCGDAQLELELSGLAKRIRSYDLLAANQRVIVADIAKLPLKSSTQDYAVFCLSLMGTNYIEFVIEALRVLKPTGRMLIAEVESRSKDWEAFQAMIEYLNCKLIGKSISKYFRTMTFEKLLDSEATLSRPIDKEFASKPYGQSTATLLEVSQQLLRPCIYKKR